MTKYLVSVQTQDNPAAKVIVILKYPRPPEIIVDLLMREPEIKLVDEVDLAAESIIDTQGLPIYDYTD